MSILELLPQILLLLGVGFLVANLRLAGELARWWRRRAGALLVWPGRKPPYYGVSLGIGVLLGALILYKTFVQSRPPSQLFGELMMFVYYGYGLPLSTRIARGLYADGIWTDTGFMPYEEIGGIAWRDGPASQTLVIIARHKAIARRLQVPGALLGEVRRLLREKISSHDIEMETGPGLHLGDRDARDSV